MNTRPDEIRVSERISGSVGPYHEPSPKDQFLNSSIFRPQVAAGSILTRGAARAAPRSHGIPAHPTTFEHISRHKIFPPAGGGGLHKHREWRESRLGAHTIAGAQQPLRATADRRLITVCGLAGLLETRGSRPRARQHRPKRCAHAEISVIILTRWAAQHPPATSGFPPTKPCHQERRTEFQNKLLPWDAGGGGVRAWRVDAVTPGSTPARRRVEATPSVRLRREGALV